MYVANSVLLYPNVRGKVIVVYSQEDSPFSHDSCFDGQDFPAITLGVGSCKQGTFGEFMGIIAAMAFARDRGAAGVKVNLAPNWWPEYFEQPATSDPAAPEYHFNSYLSRFGLYSSFNNYYFDGSFPCPTARPPMPAVRDLVQAEVHLRKGTAARLDAFTKQHFAGRHVVGIHFRGTDKILVSGQRPVELYVAAARSVARPDSLFYVATDVDFALDKFRAAFPGRVVSIDMARAAETEVMGLHRSGKGKVDDAMMDMLRLSRTDFLIKGRSGLSDVSLLVSPKPLPHMFI
eukprot:g7231.t1